MNKIFILISLMRAFCLGVIFGGYAIGLHAEELSKLSTGNDDSFDPDGYYFPSEQIVLSKKYLLNFIDINLKDHYSDQGQDEKKPLDIKPDVRLSFKDLKTKKSLLAHCQSWSITSAKVDITCSTNIGKMTIQGSFLDTRGQFWDKDDIFPRKTIVMKAIILVKKSNEAIEKIPVSFTYWEGD